MSQSPGKCFAVQAWKAKLLVKHIITHNLSVHPAASRPQFCISGITYNSAACSGAQGGGPGFINPLLPVAPPHILNSCLFSLPLPSHDLGSLLLSNIGGASATLTPQGFRFAFATPCPSWWCTTQADLTHILTAFICLHGAKYSTPWKTMLCLATAEIFSPCMASTAVSQYELAALRTRPFSPRPRQQAASTSSAVFIYT